MENFEGQFLLKENKLENEEERKKIELIEKSSFLDTNEKIDLVLLLLEKKQTAWMGDCRIIRKKGQKAKFLNYLAEKKEKTENFLNELGFVYQSEKLKIEDEVIIGYDIKVSKDEKSLSKLIKACEKKDNKEIGLMLDYPKTAVEAYPNNLLDFREWQKRLSNKEKKKLIKSNVLKFLNFQPSKDHWQEELEMVKENQNLINEETPLLYKEVIKLEEDPLKKIDVLKTKFRGTLNLLKSYKRN